VPDMRAQIDIPWLEQENRRRNL